MPSSTDVVKMDAEEKKQEKIRIKRIRVEAEIERLDNFYWQLRDRKKMHRAEEINFIRKEYRKLLKDVQSECDHPETFDEDAGQGWGTVCSDCNSVLRIW